MDTMPKQPNGKEGESAHKNLHTKQDMQKIVRKASLVFFFKPSVSGGVVPENFSISIHYFVHIFRVIMT